MAIVAGYTVYCSPAALQRAKRRRAELTSRRLWETWELAWLSETCSAEPAPDWPAIADCLGRSVLDVSQAWRAINTPAAELVPGPLIHAIRARVAAGQSLLDAANELLGIEPASWPAASGRTGSEVGVEPRRLERRGGGGRPGCRQVQSA